MDDRVHFQRNPGEISREAAGKAVLAPAVKAAESFLGMASNHSGGTFYWKVLEREHSCGEPRAKFARKYELVGEQVLQDVTEFIETALSRNMVLRC